MIALLTLAAVLCGAFVIGWGIHRLFPHVENRFSRSVVPVFAGIFVFFIALLGFSLFGLSVPAYDAGRFAGRSSVEILFAVPASSNKFTSASIAVVTPIALRANEDGAVDLSITHFYLAPPGGEAFFEAGKAVEVRTPQPCTTLNAVASRPASLVCAADDSGEGYEWIVHSTKEGSSIGVIKLPTAIATQIKEAEDGWKAQVMLDGYPLQLITRNGRDEIGPMSLKDSGSKDLNLSAQRLGFHYNYVAADLRTGIIQFPLKFETTLGVSARVYSWLRMAGSILSAVLGSGWLWQLRSWHKEEREKLSETKKRRPVRRRNE